MPTATKATEATPKSETAPETALSGSSAIAAAITETNAQLEKLNQQAEAVGSDIAAAEAELKAQQAQLEQTRREEQAEAKERALSEQLRALKAKAAKLNQAAAAFAELYEGFRSDYSRYLNSLGPTESQQYYLGGSRFSASSLPFVAMEEGSPIVRVTTLASAPKDGSNGGEQ